MKILKIKRTIIVAPRSFNSWGKHSKYSTMFTTQELYHKVKLDDMDRFITNPIPEKKPTIKLKLFNLLSIISKLEKNV
jgi:hypothetical protein